MRDPVREREAVCLRKLQREEQEGKRERERERERTGRARKRERDDGVFLAFPGHSSRCCSVLPGLY